MQKVQKKLKGLKNIGTSIAGRLVILKSVPESIPIYWLNLSKVPNTVISKIDKLRKEFLWNGMNLDHCIIHLVGWNKVCKHKKEGGLGISSIRQRNTALLAKWWWRFKSEPNNLWRIFISNKYG